jgi:hypothetical protein
MLRVISQERAHDSAWAAYLQGAGKKSESFEQFARRVGAEARTPPPTAALDAERAKTVERVKRRLGRFYKPPLNA